jgi:uncharacterized protein (TIGR02145 family)
MKHLTLIGIAVMALMVCCKKDKKTGLASITTSAISNITSNSAQTGGNITDDGGSSITKRGVCWGLHAAPTVADSITSDGSGGGSFVSNVSGLSANATYYVRAYVINASGTAYGEEVSFKTQAGLATVTTTPVVDIVALSAKSGGNISNDGGASITARGVVWSTNPNPTIANFKTTDGAGTGTFTSVLSPLASQTTYYVRAYATNSYGTSYGAQVQFNAASANTVTDIEGNVYPYVTIGTQNWMTRNLKVTKYKNGDDITNALTNYNWTTSTTGAYTFPDGLTGKKDTFGLMYNLYAVKDSRGVCPTGWHMPSDEEWKILEKSQGMTQVEADQFNDFPGRGTIGAKLLEGGSGGINIQKAGMVFIDNGTPNYFGINEWGLYWSSTPVSTQSNIYRGFNLGTPDAGPIARTWTDNSYVISIRCVKD